MNYGLEGNKTQTRQTMTEKQLYYKQNRQKLSSPQEFLNNNLIQQNNFNTQQPDQTRKQVQSQLQNHQAKIETKNYQSNSQHFSPKLQSNNSNNNDVTSVKTNYKPHI